MSKLLRRLLALALAAVTVCALPAAAWAAGSGYPSNQYFEEDTGLTKGTTVQVSASQDLHGAEKTRQKMLDAGYDCFVYFEGSHYRVMCGKFRSSADANHYRDHICSHTDRDHAYLTNVYLPEWAYKEFEKLYETDPFNTQNQGYTAWEKPSGPFYDGDSADGTRTVYTVQVSHGTNFHRQEEHRDELIAAGFDAFVYKHNGSYASMSGMFSSSADAKVRCDAIKTYTSQTDAYVTTVDIPTGSVSYQSNQSQAPYYQQYAPLLSGYRWAVDYLPDERITTLQNASRTGTEYTYWYYVTDLDGNGVDELIVVETVLPNNGTWAIFSCDSRGKVYLVAWGYPYGVPVLSVCREKKTLAMQSYYSGLGVCDVYTFANGSLSDAKRATAQDSNYVSVDPSQADSNALGYYVELTPYNYTDLSRLTGTGSQAAANTPVNSPASQPASSPASSSDSYTHDGVLAAARSAAASNSHYSTVSDENVSLEVPADSQFLRSPFQMRAYAQKNGKAIYIIPKPAPGNGTLGKVTHGELVTIVAETDYYYFFVTSDGRAGWNGKSYFSDP